MSASAAKVVPITDNWGRSVPPPTAEQLETTQYVLGLLKESPLIPNQKFAYLDLSDPQQYQFFMDRFGNLAGHPLGSNFPSRTQLMDFMARQARQNVAHPRPMLNAQTAAPATYQPVALISMFDYDAANPDAVTAGGLISVPQGATLIDSMMEIYQDGQRIAVGTGTGYGQYTVAANATGTQVTPGVALTAVLSGHYSDGTTSAAVPFTLSEDLIPVPPLTLTVTNPVHRITAPGSSITVALGRYANPPAPQDTDYSYNIGSNPLNLDLELTVTGTAVPQKPTDQFNPAVAVTGSLVLVRQGGSTAGGGMVVTYPGSVAAACTVTPSSLTWTFNPADFQKAPPPWTSGDTILLNMSLIVQMNGTTPVTVTVTSDQSGNIVGQQPDNTAFIDSLIFYWGCLAAESRITMADGSRKAVRDVTEGDRVQTAGGETMTVFATKTGREAKPMIRVTSASGRQLLVTDGHPIATSEGLKAARDLAVGDRILECDGVHAVHAVEAVSYDGAIFNLTLIDDAGAFPDHAAFLAEGIFVGDDRMQTRIEKAGVARLAHEAEQALRDKLRGWELDIENHRRALAGEPLLAALEQH